MIESYSNLKNWFEAIRNLSFWWELLVWVLLVLAFLLVLDLLLGEKKYKKLKHICIILIVIGVVAITLFCSPSPRKSSAFFYNDLPTLEGRHCITSSNAWKKLDLNGNIFDYNSSESFIIKFKAQPFVDERTQDLDTVIAFSKIPMVEDFDSTIFSMRFKERNGKYSIEALRGGQSKTGDNKYDSDETINYNRNKIFDITINVYPQMRSYDLKVYDEFSDKYKVVANKYPFRRTGGGFSDINYHQSKSLIGYHRVCFESIENK